MSRPKSEKIYDDKLLKSEEMFVGNKCTVLEMFPDWKDVFDYFEFHGDVSKLKDFVLALQEPYHYLRTAKHFWFEIMSPAHVEAFRGHHKLIQLLLESPLNFNAKTLCLDFEEDDYWDRFFDRVKKGEIVEFPISAVGRL